MREVERTLDQLRIGVVFFTFCQMCDEPSLHNYVRLIVRAHDRITVSRNVVHSFSSGILRMKIIPSTLIVSRKKCATMCRAEFYEMNIPIDASDSKVNTVAMNAFHRSNEINK